MQTTALNYCYKTKEDFLYVNQHLPKDNNVCLLQASIDSANLSLIF